MGPGTCIPDGPQGFDARGRAERRMTVEDCPVGDQESLCRVSSEVGNSPGDPMPFLGSSVFQAWFDSCFPCSLPPHLRSRNGSSGNGSDTSQSARSFWSGLQRFGNPCPVALSSCDVWPL